MPGGTVLFSKIVMASVLGAFLAILTLYRANLYVHLIFWKTTY